MSAKSWLQSLLLGLLTMPIVLACAKTDETDFPHIDLTTEQDISFVGVQNDIRQTRAAGASESFLQTNGFGILAFHTEEANFLKDDGTINGSPTANFMYNQEATYDDVNNVWTYSPKKYWPNGNTEMAADGTITGAGGKVSYFAYAPFRKDSYASMLSLSDKDVSDPYVTLTAGAAGGLDLMWAVANADGEYKLWPTNDLTASTTEGVPLTDLQRPYSSDYKVAFRFKHAMSKLLPGTIRGVFDEISPATGTINTDETRIFVNSITISGFPTFSGSKLYLRNTEKDIPRWDINGEGTVSFNVGLADELTYDKGSVLVSVYDKVNKEYTTAPAFITTKTGVTEVEKEIGSSEYLFIPKSSITLTVAISYDVVTKDEALVRNTPAGFSVVTNEISQTVELSPSAGIAYRLNILLGMTSVKLDIKELNTWTSSDKNAYLPDDKDELPDKKKPKP